jgi:uncharacterized protein DUF4342
VVDGEVSVVVHSSGNLLAAGTGGACPFSADLAGAAALPDRRDRGMFGIVSRSGNIHIARARSPETINNMAIDHVIEEIKVMSHELADKVKSLIHEGNVNRIIIKDEKGHTFVEIPVTVAAVGAVLAPVVAAVGAIVGSILRHGPLRYSNLAHPGC